MPGPSLFPILRVSPGQLIFRKATQKRRQAKIEPLCHKLLVLYFSLAETADRGFVFCVSFLVYSLETLPLADNADVFGIKPPAGSPKFARGAYFRHRRHGSSCFVEDKLPGIHKYSSSYSIDFYESLMSCSRDAAGKQTFLRIK